MPCSSGYPDEDLWRIQNELEKATRAACELFNALKQSGCSYCERRNNDFMSALSPATQKWVKKHERIDKERRSRERKEKKERKAKKRALKKLTKAERELLGLNKFKNF